MVSATVFHGSPHKFDAFDLSKIGTGEGAQAYGHGLYFAGNEGVARSYRDTLSSEVYRTPKGDIWSPDSLQHLNIRNQARQNPFELGFAISRAEDLLKTAPPATRPMLEADLAALRTLQDAGGLKSVPGHIYEVNLNTTPDRLLDWDAPLSGQSPQVRAAIETVSPSTMRYMETIPGKAGDNGGFILSDIAEQIAGNRKAGAVEAASRLREAGIPGIQYLDAGSRAAGDGTRNYVMFDDKLIDILRRYGIAGTLGGGAAATSGTSE
jgi:hypothetical protein